MRYDAVVIGAGPAGATAALILARAGWSVAIVEKARYPRRKVCGEFMSATNVPLFAELGLSHLMSRAAGPEIRRVGLFARDAEIVAPMPTTASKRFVPRIRMASLFAHLAMQPRAVTMLLPLLKHLPALLTLGAGLSGKTQLMFPVHHGASTSPR